MIAFTWARATVIKIVLQTVKTSVRAPGSATRLLALRTVKSLVRTHATAILLDGERVKLLARTPATPNVLVLLKLAPLATTPAASKALVNKLVEQSYDSVT